MSSSNNSKTHILTHEQINARIRRMAYEIYEHNYDQKQLVMVGVGERGGFINRALIDYLGEIAPFKIKTFNTEPDREAEGMMGLDQTFRPKDFAGKVVIVVDDVLYSGRTLLSVVAQILPLEPLRIQTLVLIDRGHRSMPISPDFVGLELGTTLHQHVTVELAPRSQQLSAFLS